MYLHWGLLGAACNKQYIPKTQNFVLAQVRKSLAVRCCTICKSFLCTTNEILILWRTVLFIRSFPGRHTDISHSLKLIYTLVIVHYFPANIELLFVSHGYPRVTWHRSLCHPLLRLWPELWLSDGLLRTSQFDRVVLVVSHCLTAMF